MLQNALPALGLLLAMMVVAWLLQKWRRHLPGVARQTGPALKVMNSLALGPQQRVVTVQVGEGAGQMCLVLGVTPGGISALHQMALTPQIDALPAQTEGFKTQLSQALDTSKQGSHAQS